MEFKRRYIAKIGRNLSVRSKVLPSGSKDYADRKIDKDTENYSDRYKGSTTSSNDLTTVPSEVITIKDPINCVFNVLESKEGTKATNNKATFEFYNLSEETSDRIRTGDSIFFQAGHYISSTDISHIFIGQITVIRTNKVRENTITYIEASACDVVRNGAAISKSYPKNSTLGDMVKDLAGVIAKSGMPLGEINSQPIAQRLLSKVYPSGYAVQGNPLRALERICDANGMRAYVSQGRLFVEPKQPRGQLTKVVTVGPNQFKGQIYKEKDKRGEERTKEDDNKDSYDLKLTLVLDGNITTDAIVRMEVKGYEGTYSIKSISHSGQWHGGEEWDTVVTLVSVKF